MSTKYVSDGNALNVVVATTAVLSGEVRMYGVTVVVHQSDGAVGATVPGVCVGVHGPLPKATGEAWAVGAKLYWHNTNLNFTTTAAGTQAAGHAAKAAASGDTTGYVRLQPA